MLEWYSTAAHNANDSNKTNIIILQILGGEKMILDFMILTIIMNFVQLMKNHTHTEITLCIRLPHSY